MVIIAGIVFALAGIILVIWGADKMTAGAVSAAAKLGVPQIVIGLTVVAMGTSAPELFVSLASALKGTPDLAVGNVVGSNIFNTLVIVGAAALVLPLSISVKTIKRDLPISVAAGIVLLILSCDGNISRIDSALLLAAFIGFLAYNIRRVRKDGAEDDESASVSLSGVKSALYIVLGLACLIFGSDLFVDGATVVAGAMGVSDAVIGLTVVALGTSLPELATSIVAAKKGNSSIAIGNVIGSNVFNILMIIGVTGVISPMRIEGVGPLDMAVMAGSGVLMWLFCATRHTVERIEGAVLLAAYFAYIGYLVYNI